GVAWGFGAVSTVDVTGTRLADVLERAGLRDGACAILAVGADRGHVAPGLAMAFARALPRAAALDPATLLVWEFNGTRLSEQHGAPRRLIVPGRYAVDSVKWLVRLTAIGRPFEGHFQIEDYVYRRPGEPEEQVGRMRVRSLILEPRQGTRLTRSPIELSGIAWSGGGRIRRVEVSDDGGASWLSAELEAAPSPHAAARWH